ncbi:hypothetical protein N7516_005404 [Penicillium verrucosum]|uniref:uncharacterized protein n=1 Tax=Penicillium verrucosum TaxID=60171 RepID=UPI0025456829|nr:uncharacterized protein N7516_005404 [Penicillium verrucosum]KAJ5945236.1 hypothetical protein N7516_005404 [Penicillium verrucosum]
MYPIHPIPVDQPTTSKDDTRNPENCFTPDLDLAPSYTVVQYMHDLTQMPPASTQRRKTAAVAEV